MEKLSERLRKVGSWLRSHRREVIGVLCVLALVVVVTPVFANGTPSGSPDGKIGVTSQIALWIATLFAWIAQHVVKMIVIIIDLVVVPIMRYNNFVSSPVVGQGWAVVRDLVNMFFVVILLLIAFQTIFGVGRADWKRQVPRLLIMAVVINFSRTIAGIMIDFGQVIMFTFVNAIADVAGGNFIQLFGLDKLFNYSEDAVNRASQNGVGFEVFDFFGAAFLTMVLTFVILATMIILAALLAFRIVVLWCLIIVAPLTFFLGGAKGVIGGAEGYYADWWKRFTSAVSLGPILTFFVWLSLAAASSGNLAEKQGFDVQTTNDEAASLGGEITQAFDAPHMTSLIIAVALLFAGFEVSQQTAGSIGGRAGAMAASGVKGIPGLARSLAKVGVPVGAAAGAMALAPAAALTGGGIALAGNKAWKSAAGTGVREGIVKTVGQGLRDFGGAAAKTNIPIITGFGRRVQDMGFKTLQAQNTHKEHEWEEATKANTAMGFDNMRELAKMPITKSMTEMQKMRIEHAKLAVLNNKAKSAQVTAEDIEQGGSTWAHIKGDLPDKELDKAGTNALVRFPIMLAKEHGLTDEQKKAKLVEQIGFMANSADKLREIRAQNFEDPDDGALFQEVLKETKGRATGEKSVFEYLQEGKADPTVRAWFENNEKRLTDQSRATLTNAANAFAPAAATARTAGDSAALARAVESLAQVVRGLSARDVQNGVVNPLMMTPDFAEVFGREAKPETLAAMDAGLREPFLVALDRRDAQIESDPSTTADQKLDQMVPIDEARIRAKQGPAGFDRAEGKFTGTTPAEVKQRKDVVDRTVASNPAILEQLTSALGDFKNDLAQSIADGIKKGGPGGAVDNGEAVTRKLFDALNRRREDYGAGEAGDLAYRRVQETTTAAINNLARILKETNGTTGRNTDAIALLSRKRQRAGLI